jgi:hypothetical protein
MPSRLAFLLLAIGLVATQAQAAEYNKRPFLDSGKQAKVERAIANGMLVTAQGQATASRFSNITNTNCGKLEVGNVKDTSHGVPKDVIVVTGDVINVAQNCGLPR